MAKRGKREASNEFFQDTSIYGNRINCATICARFIRETLFAFVDRVRGSRSRYYCHIQTIASPPILSATRTKCQTLNERYIFGPRGKTLVLRLAQLASLLAAETIDEDALCASIVRIVESQRSVGTDPRKKSNGSSKRDCCQADAGSSRGF